MIEIQKILNYWYNLEFFSPFWPEKTKDTILIKINLLYRYIQQDFDNIFLNYLLV